MNAPEWAYLDGRLIDLTWQKFRIIGLTELNPLVDLLDRALTIPLLAVYIRPSATQGHSLFVGTTRKWQQEELAQLAGVLNSLGPALQCAWIEECSVPYPVGTQTPGIRYARALNIGTETTSPDGAIAQEARSDLEEVQRTPGRAGGKGRPRGFVGFVKGIFAQRG